MPNNYLNQILKRSLDIFFSFGGILILIPCYLIIAFLIKASSKGSVFFIQERVGKDGKIFRLLKFRTMVQDAPKLGMSITTKMDPRITRIGSILRYTKLDELPQLINVLKGDMSLVGPRPEVKKYVDIYTDEQKKVLNVKPGITDPASIKFRDESELLEKADNPESYYIKEVMPEKLRINLQYIRNENIVTDIKIIFQTISAIIKN